MDRETTDPALPAVMLEPFAHLRAQAMHTPYPALAERLQWLSALRAMALDGEARWVDAVASDFGHRSPVETRMLELFPAVAGLRHTQRHLMRWMRPRRRGVDLLFMPARNRVIPQPKGVVGIMVPWNYPIYLTLGPLTAALAAGNRAMVKMSEFTPATGELMRELADKYLGRDVISVLDGDAQQASQFSRLPFDHLLFTGSTAVGRLVMRAASDNLTPVTLELGGKSPALVLPGYPLEKAAERIAFGKLINAGQTCIAPDYVLVHTSQRDAFAAAYASAVARAYPTLVANPDYSAVINDRHRQRLGELLDDARAHGAVVREINPAGEDLAGSGKLAPALLLEVAGTARVLKEEIFGPLLPVVSYDSLNDAVDYLNARPRPLAMYVFDEDNRRLSQILACTHAGGVTLNDTMLHIAQDDLPFGGIGPSGMGSYHGRDGFDTFSHLKAVCTQARLNGTGLIRPPYGRAVSALLRFMLR